MGSKIGFIGAGNMGGAIIGGICKAGKYSPDDIFVYEKSDAAAKRIKDEYGVNICADIKDAAEKSEILIFAVKPNVLYDVIAETKQYIKDGTAVVSIAAGQSIEKISCAFNKKLKIMRVMPNTPALVGEGMSALSPNDELLNDTAKIDEIKEIFSALGKALIVPESMMDAVTGVSGSAPAYVFMFIEALADAAVKAGMYRKDSYIFAAQAVLGSAKMVLETGKHPAELKDMVCSPAGTTIEAVEALEKYGFRNAVMQAVDACVKKSREM